MILKRSPNLSPLPRSDKEIRILLKQAQTYETADAARKQWMLDHPPHKHEIKLPSAVVHPASAERAEQLMTMLRTR